MHEPEFPPAENAATPGSAPGSVPEPAPSPSGPLSLTQQVAPWWHTILLLVVLAGFVLFPLTARIYLGSAQWG